MKRADINYFVANRSKICNLFLVSKKSVNFDWIVLLWVRISVLVNNEYVHHTKVH